MTDLPDIGFIKLKQIIGDKKTNPPTPALIPVGKTTWWNGVRSGKFPPAIKIGPKTTVWRVEHIRSLISQGIWEEG